MKQKKFLHYVNRPEAIVAIATYMRTCPGLYIEFAARYVHLKFPIPITK